MSSMLYQLGRIVGRRRWLAIVAWIVLLAAIGGGALVLQKGTDDSFAIPGSESQDALDHLGRVFPQVSGTSAQMVVVVPEGRRADTSAIRDDIATAAKRAGALPQVATVASPFDERVRNGVSPDGRAALVTVQMGVALPDVEPATKDALLAIGTDLQKQIGDGVTVSVGGAVFGGQAPALSPTEGIGLVVALVVLMLAFRSLLAAVMPLVTALIGVGIAVALVYGATAVVPIASTGPLLAVMLGLAVGIDYALFLLSRHRDQLAEGLEVQESVARATATAGSAVIFAGLTVVIALFGLAVAGIPFLTTMGVAAAGAVMIAVAIAITLIPALLSVAGERIRPRVRNRSLRRPRRRRREGAEPTRFAARWVTLVTKVPALTVAIVVAALAVCAIPALDLRLALPDNGSEEPGTPARATYDLIGEHFGAGFNGPLVMSVDILSSTDPVGVVDDVADEIRALPGVAAVPLATPNEKADTGIVQIVPADAPDSVATGDLVSTLRSMEPHFQQRYGVGTAVTGITAIGIDVSDKLGAALVPFGVLVVGLSLVLLAMVFRSIAVPIKAAVGYLLSVAAAFGATSFVFTQGHLADLLSVSHVGAVISFLPILLMGVLFGLAMDYEVFLVSRMREHYARHGDPDAAIHHGFVSASQVVVAAAVIMFAVFAAFVPDGSAQIKPIAFGLAVGVFIDAFLVRMTLVPAVMALLGTWAWWLPKWIDLRLPVFDAEGDGLLHELRLADWPEPDSPELVSAAGLRVADDRDHPVFEGVHLHVRPGQVLGVHGVPRSGKSALLYALAGRVSRIGGDLKVVGKVLPQHARSVRKRVALIDCHGADPAGEMRRALDDGVQLVLLDDLDALTRTDQRADVQDMLATITAPGSTAAAVYAAQGPDLVGDVLPGTGCGALTLRILEAV